MGKRTTLKADYKLYTRLLCYVKPYLPWLIFSFIANALYSAIDSGFIYALKPILNKGFIERDATFTLFLPLLIFVAFIARGLMNVASSYTMSYAARSVIRDLRRLLFERILTLPASYFDRISTGKLLSKIIYNVDQISSASADALTTVAQSGFLVAGLLVVMFSISWSLSLVYLIVAPIVAFAVRYSNQRARNYSRRAQHVMGDVTSVAEEVIEGYRVVRAYNGQAHETEKFYDTTEKSRQIDIKISLVKSIAVSVIQIFAAIALSIIIYLALSHHAHLTAGSFAALVAAMLAILKPLKNMTKVNSTIQAGLAGAQSVFELADQPQEKDEGTVHVDRVAGGVVFKDVNFTYPEMKQSALKQINFSVKPGQLTALVGRSGAGKSTLVSLLPRFYDNFSGQITIDGVDLQDYALKDLRQQFAIVSQYVVLFNDTIRHNIAYGQFSDVDESALIEAAKAAHAWEFIETLSEGLDTRVGENGMLLSGGQRQRLAIARAILKDAPILILDEATAALDTESERIIQEALENLMKDRTTFVIAHRLSTVEKADNILVMDEGKIVESGQHRDLLARNQQYARLYQMQFRDE